MVGDVEHLITPPLLAFAGFQPTVIPCCSIVQQIAEKFHAYTRPRSTGESTRVKDLVDILILASTDRIDAKELLSALKVTFDSSGTHRLTMDFPDPPAAWRRRRALCFGGGSWLTLMTFWPWHHLFFGIASCRVSRPRQQGSRQESSYAV